MLHDVKVGREHRALRPVAGLFHGHLAGEVKRNANTLKGSGSENTESISSLR